MKEESHIFDATLRRVAVIDCGTNTFNLRIVEFLRDVDPGFRPWKKLFSLRLPVRIGKVEKVNVILYLIS